MLDYILQSVGSPGLQVQVWEPLNLRIHNVPFNYGEYSKSRKPFKRLRSLTWLYVGVKKKVAIKPKGTLKSLELAFFAAVLDDHNSMDKVESAGPIDDQLH